ncbi:hypothetical protein TNCV_42691 [Trichonephila clavipes]|nr:hypothetical protein TNCV_42691 [Trichonephila clavipes]
MTCLPWLDTLTTGLPQPSIQPRNSYRLYGDIFYEFDIEEEGQVLVFTEDSPSRMLTCIESTEVSYKHGAG